MDRVIRDETPIEKNIAAIFVNCFRSRMNYTLDVHNLRFIKLLKSESEQKIKFFFMFQMGIIQTSINNRRKLRKVFNPSLQGRPRQHISRGSTFLCNPSGKGGRPSLFSIDHTRGEIAYLLPLPCIAKTPSRSLSGTSCR
jgi:hypothetical protein